MVLLNMKKTVYHMNFEFIKWVLSNGELQGSQSNKINRRSLTLSNLIMYNVITDRQRRYTSEMDNSLLQHRYEPLQITGTGLAIRKFGRHKNLVNLMVFHHLTTNAYK